MDYFIISKNQEAQHFRPQLYVLPENRCICEFLGDYKTIRRYYKNPRRFLCLRYIKCVALGQWGMADEKLVEKGWVRGWI